MSAVLLSDIGDVYTGAGPDVLAYTPPAPRLLDLYPLPDGTYPGDSRRHQHVDIHRFLRRFHWGTPADPMEQPGATWLELYAAFEATQLTIDTTAAHRRGVLRPSTTPAPIP